MGQTVFLLPDTEVTGAINRAIGCFGYKGVLTEGGKKFSPYSVVIIDIYSFKETLSLSSSGETIHYLRSLNWKNHFLALLLRTDNLPPIYGTTFVYSLEDILKRLSNPPMPLNDYELEKARLPAILIKIDKWLHDLGRVNDLRERAFEEIKADIDNSAFLQYKPALLKTIERKNIPDLKSILLKISGAINQKESI